MAGVWRKTLVYLGLVEDEEYDDYGYEDLEMDEAQPRRPAPRGRGEAADGGGQQREAVVRAMPSAAPQARFHLVMPSSFNDV